MKHVHPSKKILREYEEVKAKSGNCNSLCGKPDCFEPDCDDCPYKGRCKNAKRGYMPFRPWYGDPPVTRPQIRWYG